MRIFACRLSFIATCCILSARLLSAQDITDNTFGKGIRTIAKDSTFYMKFSWRIQNRYDGTYQNTPSPVYRDNFNIRRSRLKFDGFAFSPKLVYKFEYDLVGNEIYDAVVKWNFYKNLTIWYGQAKLPGNVERVISSQKLQFVDRSLLNDAFNIDRDKGFQFRHHFYLGKTLLREIAAVSQGEGRNFDADYDNVGNDYTGRLEVLPFGEFTGRGEYFSSDLYRERSLKIMLSVSFDFNDEAIRRKGQRGNVLSEQRDLETFFADLVLKYRGISFLSEYANKFISGESPVIYDETGLFREAFYTGQGVNAQIGYLFVNNLEIAYRFTEIMPEKSTLYNNKTQHTLGFSRYISGHNLKVQSDVSYIAEDNKNDNYVYRLQVELSF